MDMIPLFKERMELLNISVNKLAKLVGISPSTLSRHLNGETKKMSTELENKLKDALGITFDISTDYINRAIKKKEIHNMEIVDIHTTSQCNVCGTYNDEDKSIKELRLGRNNQVICANLCSKCRKDLIHKLLFSVGV